MNSNSLTALEELARFHGLETSYYDGLGNYRQASAETVIAVLAALDCPVSSPEMASSVLEETRLSRLERQLDPVQVHWQGQPLEVILTCPEGAASPSSLFLRLESGEEREFPISLDPSRVESSTDWAGRRFLHHRVTIEHSPPPGYHHLSLTSDGLTQGTTLISAPSLAHQPPEQRRWGVFLPLYALHTKRSWGTGDYSDLQALMEWVGTQGGSLLGTLPLFPAFLDHPYSPSPYTPVSRLFWNEFYLDPRWCLELVRTPAAQQLIGSARFVAEIGSLNQSRTVDYREISALKRRALEPIVATVTRPEAVHPDFMDYLQAHPLALEYAQFRARIEEDGPDRNAWEESIQSSTDAFELIQNPHTAYHAVAQWLCHRQVGEVLSRGHEIGVDLYLDLPLGVHPDGFDAWRWSDSFVPGISGGAPPDGFFTEGQDWGFPPLHPERIRSEGYAYLRHVISHLTRHCRLVRIDHAMSLQRLYWVPLGMTAKEGLYVHYRSDELFAVLCIESARNECALVGEDLGTVTPEIRENMDRRGVHRMYVGQFEFSADQTPPFHDPPRRVVASLNTHDTPTAAGFWYGDDIDDRVQLGILEQERAASELEARGVIRSAFMRYLDIEGDELDPDVQYAVLRGWLEHLAASEALQLLVSLEDLLQERVPQNVPGTVDERPNWRRKTHLSFERLCNDPRLADTLLSIDTKRQSH